MSKPTQADLVLTMLHTRPEGVCGTAFLQFHIPRYAARMGELREAGHKIGKRRCDFTWHVHQSPQWVYFLEDEPEQMPLYRTEATG